MCQVSVRGPPGGHRGIMISLSINIYWLDNLIVLLKSFDIHIFELLKSSIEMCH